MTTIGEQLRGEAGSIVAIAIIVGVIAALAIVVIAFGGAFDRTAGDGNLTLQTPTAPSNPPVPESVPNEAQPQPQPIPEPPPAPVQ